jgi:hypothetical protein
MKCTQETENPLSKPLEKNTEQSLAAFKNTSQQI